MTTSAETVKNGTKSERNSPLSSVGKNNNFNELTPETSDDDMSFRKFIHILCIRPANSNQDFILNSPFTDSKKNLKPNKPKSEFEGIYLNFLSLANTLSFNKTI